MAHELLVVLLPGSISVERIEQTVNDLVRPHSDIDDPNKRNPRCDRRVIGGRFDGAIYGTPMEYSLTPQEFQARYGLCFENVELQSNVRPIPQIEESFWTEVNAFLTPDGTWTSVFDPQFKDAAFENPMNGPKWQAFKSTIIASHQDNLAVVVDVHM